MEAWLPLLGFAPLIGAVRWPLCVGPGTGVSGPWSGWPRSVVVVAIVVVVVAGVVGPRMMIDGGTCYRPKRLPLLLLFPCTRSGRFLRN